MTKRILIAAGAVAVLSLSSIRALGCLCGISSVEGVFHTSKIVFIGKVTKIKHAKEATVGLLMKESGTLELLKEPRWEKSTYGARIVSFEILEAFKGTTNQTIDLVTAVYDHGATCGVNFKPGETYLVYASDRRRELSTDQANAPKDQWTKEIQLKAEADQFNKALPALTTSICDRTRHIRWAKDDVDAIRRILSGDTLQKEPFKEVGVFKLNGMKRPTKKHLALNESNCTEGVLNEVALHMGIAAYPPKARQKHVGGKVTVKVLLLVSLIFLMEISSSGQEGIGGRVARRPSLGCACVENPESDSQNSSRQKPSEKECREKGDVVTVYNGNEVDKKAVITERPQPDFSSLRLASGRAVLKVVLCPHGSVGRVGIIIGASDQINDLVIRAAREIKFEPAVKNGKKVAQYLQLEYSFGTPDQFGGTIQSPVSIASNKRLKRRC